MTDPLASLIRPRRGPALAALERLAPAPPENLVAAEIEARTVAGDVIVELHGRGGWVARAAIDRLRRAFAIESTALTRLVAEIVLRPPDLRHLDAALNSLAIHPRGEAGLRSAVNATFASRCAACGGAVIVDEFIWEADGTAPVRKSYRCGHCRDPRTEGRPVAVDTADVRLARSVDASPARSALLARFPVPDPEHPLPHELLDLFTPRVLSALGAIVERVESDLRAPSIQACLRLALVHALVPASRLNGYPGRVAQLRVVSGRVRPPTSRQWRERNLWLLFEEGCRAVRTFVQRMENAPGGHVLARVGGDLDALLDGSSNVALRFGMPTEPSAFAPGLSSRRAVRRGEPGRGVRLVLTQPPIHWTPESLGFAYLATSVAMGADAAATLPLQALFGAVPKGEWAWDAAALRRGLAAVGPALAHDGRIVILLDRAGPGGLVAGVIGGVAAGYRVDDVVLAESGDEIVGTLELAPLDAPVRRDRTLPDYPEPEPGAPFLLSAVESAVTQIAVAVLQARGEPARFERLLGEVLIGLDRMGHLRRLVGTRTFVETEERAEASARAVGLFGELPVGSHPARPSARRRASAWREPVPSARHSTIDLVGGPAPVPARRTRSTATGSEGYEGVARSPGPEGPAAATAPADRGAGVPPGTSSPAAGSPWPGDGAASASSASAAASSGAAATAHDDRSLFAAAEPIPGWNDIDAGADPVRLTLEIVLGELRRPDHPRLVELEPGRWWLRDRADLAGVRPPLSDRVEWAVFSLLSTSGGLPEGAFFDRVARMFRGHDSPDEELVRACLDSYRTRGSLSEELLRTDETLRDRYEEHGLLVGLLAGFGHRLGMRVWIGRREQRRTVAGRPLSEHLSEAEQRVYLPLVVPGAPEAVEALDCIWYVRNHAVFLFDVEWTAMLGEPVLQRGGAIPTTEGLVRFLVVPPERTDLLRLKLARSPLLRERMEEGNWHILKSSHLRRLCAAEGADLDALAPLLGLDPEIERQGSQLALFVPPPGEPQ